MTIKVEELTESDIGREVRYKPWPNCPKGVIEFGVIVSFNQSVIFVRYDGGRNAKGTTPSDLEFVWPVL